MRVIFIFILPKVPQYCAKYRGHIRPIHIATPLTRSGQVLYDISNFKDNIHYTEFRKNKQ